MWLVNEPLPRCQPGRIDYRLRGVRRALGTTPKVLSRPGALLKSAGAEMVAAETSLESAKRFTLDLNPGLKWKNSQALSGHKRQP